MLMMKSSAAVNDNDDEYALSIMLYPFTSFQAKSVFRFRGGNKGSNPCSVRRPADGARLIVVWGTLTY